MLRLSDWLYKGGNECLLGILGQQIFDGVVTLHVWTCTQYVYVSFHKLQLFQINELIFLEKTTIFTF